ncbi:MAG: hypothetical protein H7A09_10680 [Oceanospirillaceae bacterium]|nr:hypothetical protein [Oceanospirillaceae bacterium]
MSELTNVVYRDGLQNMPGTGLKIKINWSDNITTWPELPAAPATDVEEVTVEHDFVCATPFNEWDFIPKTGKIESTKIGSAFECSYSGSLFVPSGSSGNEAKANIKKILNSRLALGIPLINGDTIVAGESYDLPAMLESADGSTGTVGEDGTVKLDVTIKWISNVPGGAFMTGDIPTS